MFNFYQTNSNRPAIVQYISGHQAEIIKEDRTVAIPLSSAQIFMDYIVKQIDAIDKARIEMRQENPNFLPRLA